MAPNEPSVTAVAPKPLRILYVEHEQNDVEIALRELKRSNLVFESETAATREEFASKLREKTFDIILADYRLPGWTGMDALSLIKERGLDIPFVLITGTLGEELAVEPAIPAGHRAIATVEVQHAVHSGSVGLPVLAENGHGRQQQRVRGSAAMSA